jgi:starvation-inducible DNA-binding protein
MSMNPTKNDLAEAHRHKVVALCQDRLADAIDLQTMCKQAHWNVKGPQFQGLHALFDTIYEDVLGYVDLIAERAVQLGGQIEGTTRAVARRTSLAEYPLEARSGPDHVEAMSSALAAFGQHVRAAIARSEASEDAGTADMFTEVARGIDKHLWMVEAHKQQADAQYTAPSISTPIKAVQ